MIWLIIIGAVVGILILLNLKTSRPDGTLISKLHPYRKVMPHIMPTRNESVVYFDAWVKAEKLLEYVDAARERFHCDITHCVVAAATHALYANPSMNRFVMGRRLYQRKEVEVSFSMKRKKLDKKAKIAVVDLVMDEGESFFALCERINGKVSVERSSDKTYMDKELDLFRRIPRPVMRFATGLWRWLDYYNLMPRSLIEGDAFYTSIFVANLGSLGMGAAFHHLYEWGTCPLFMMVGQIEDTPVVEDGEVAVRKLLHLRFSYDERIDDGLTARFGIASAVEALEDPERVLGCLAADGSDDHPLLVAEDN